ncbi:MAG: hypothetical protein EXQ94_10940 [Alphaproteobacteria bacterium]|nr:hypothetical protein [Alphaproteobacteria bacterium]
MREQAGKFSELWPDGLLQLACFNGRNAGFVDPEVDAESWSPNNPKDFWRDAMERVYDHGRRATSSRLTF